MSYQDKTLTCVDCGSDFTFTSGEQEFYAQKGIPNDPKRCKNCRANKKAQHQGERRQFFTVTCDECGKETQVPFKPTNDKPVYCRECYQAKKTG